MENAKGELRLKFLVWKRLKSSKMKGASSEEECQELEEICRKMHMISEAYAAVEYAVEAIDSACSSSYYNKLPFPYGGRIRRNCRDKLNS
ncbi:hypothetical protein NC651_029414 [Populus alba x Populus x berolinensis]|nr:hypothetical protein NC651_029414 [Populus alba x Populus x berolinensis]